MTTISYSLINNFNAIKAAHYLLELNLDTIDERYRQDAQAWILNLQAALQIYKAHAHKTLASPLNQEDSSYLNQCLQRLSNYANSMVYILTKEAKEGVRQYLLTTPALAA